jgi:PadR family transcriptional regulator PadR
VKTNESGKETRRSNGIEDKLKKALTEMLILYLFGEEDHYIGELSPLLQKRSRGVLNLVFPYAAIYRMSQAGYLEEIKKRIAPDGRLRQYYQITDEGRVYLKEMLVAYHVFFEGICHILEDPTPDEEADSNQDTQDETKTED